MIKYGFLAAGTVVEDSASARSGSLIMEAAGAW